VSARRARTLVATAVAATTLVVVAPAGAAAPVVDQMVVFKDGSAKVASVRASATRVKVGRKRCAIGAGTPLAALVRGKVGTLRYTDYGSCGKRAADSGGLYVRAIDRDVARAEDGWVYKVGNKAAPAGAADPSGPFGRGPLKARQRVTWFWCDQQPDVEGCQQTLDMKVTSTADHAASVRVRGYDNAGRGTGIAGATVSEGDTVLGTTEASGQAAIPLAPGTHTLVARKDGLVRSYPVEVTVR
jgi:hypothetical protein